jgi:hypothetical protein
MRRLPSVLVLAVLLAGVLSAPAPAAYFPGDAIDGPSGDVRALGDVDLARDGSGALAYVKADGGVDHVYVARFEHGLLQPPERIDITLPGPSSQPVLGASDSGRLAVAFVNSGTVYGVVRPSGLPFSPPVPLGPGLDPSVDLSINGTAYASYTSNGDVRIARLDRRSNAWIGLVSPVDVDPAREAGVGGGRSRVAISADGIGVVTWGEAGHVFARKMFNAGLSNAPQDLTPPDFAGRVATVSDLPDIDAEDDSSYAWVVFRQTFADGGSRILARRQRGTQFDPPVALDTGDEPVRDPRIDLNGRGLGLATMAGASTGQPMTALIDVRDAFGLGSRLLTPSVAGPAAVPSISENNSAVVAAVLAGAGPASVAVRPYVDGKPEAPLLLSRPELGVVAPERGFDVASDRAGGVLFAWVQGGDADRKIVTAYYDRPPATFLGYTSQRCCGGVAPSLRWQESFNLWGPLRYELLIDNKLVGQTAGNTLALPGPLAGGTHTWQVRAIDVRGQATRSKTRLLRIDARKPLLAIGYKRRKRVVTMSVRGRDDSRTSSLVSGMKEVKVAWGDNGIASVARSRLKVTHRYRRGGTYTITVTGRDKVGNVAVDSRVVRMG